MDERRRLAESTKPRERKTHEPGQPLQMPDIVRPGSGATTTTAAPAAGGAPAVTPGNPITRPILTPGARSLPAGGVSPANPSPPARSE